MITLLIIIILLVVTWPAIKAGYKMWKQVRDMRRFMNDPLGEMQRRAQQEQRQRERQARRQAAADPRTYAQGSTLKKKIPSDIGEYVAFTDIEGTASQSCDVPPTVTEESQIVDIEWEDIPQR